MSEDSGRTSPQDLLAAYAAVRATTERLAAPLSAEDQTVQSMPDVSPTKWHRAHVSWFFETFVLGSFQPDYRPFHDDFAYIFNSYYEALGERHPRSERGLISRPGIDEIARYRQAVDLAMDSFLRGDLEPAVPDLVTLGLHHEQQHQELLLMDIKHVLSRNPLKPAYLPPAAPEVKHEPPPKTGWIEHEGGVTEIGHDGRGFGFDNEFPRHRVHLSPFSLADRPVTCGEWISFMDDSGTSSRCPVRDRWIPTSRCATSATTRPMPMRTGPACACRRKPNGSPSLPGEARVITSWARDRRTRGPP